MVENNNFDVRSNYDEKSSFSEVIFGAKKQILEVELNEMQEIIQTKIKQILKIIGSGINLTPKDGISLDDIYELGSDNILHIKDCIVSEENGYLFYAKDETVQLDSVGDIAYFKIWEEDVDYNSTLYEYGNVNGMTITNTIMDIRSSVETTRRKVTKHELLKGDSVPSNTDTIKYVEIGKWTDGGFEITNSGTITNVCISFKNLLSEFDSMLTELNTLSEKVAYVKEKIDQGVTSGFRSITLDEYKALSEEEQKNGYVYLVKDAIVVDCSKESMSSVTTFDGDVVTETYDDGSKDVTTTLSDGNVVKEYYDSDGYLVRTEKTIFNEDGSITKEVQ